MRKKAVDLIRFIQYREQKPMDVREAKRYYSSLSKKEKRAMRELYKLCAIANDQKVSAGV